jgi:hypothetical protein
MSKKLKNAAKNIASKLSFRSTRSRTSSQAASSQGDSEMEIDPPSPAMYGTSSHHREPKAYVLTRDSHLKLQNSQERAIYDALKSKEFSHTPLFDELLL